MLRFMHHFNLNLSECDYLQDKRNAPWIYRLVYFVQRVMAWIYSIRVYSMRLNWNELRTFVPAPHVIAQTNFPHGYTNTNICMYLDQYTIRQRTNYCEQIWQRVSFHNYMDLKYKHLLYYIMQLLFIFFYSYKDH